MSEACTGGAASGVAGWLSLAAAPTFAVMALLTHLSGGPPDSLCSVGTSLHLGGMVPMYLLMSAFHAAPWLKLIGGRA
jgi:predicted phage tail protein